MAKVWNQEAEIVPLTEGSKSATAAEKKEFERFTEIWTHLGRGDSDWLWAL